MLHAFQYYISFFSVSINSLRNKFISKLINYILNYREGNPAIYEFLDWSRDPGYAISAVFAVIAFGCIIHGTMFLLFVLRSFLKEKYFVDNADKTNDYETKCNTHVSNDPGILSMVLTNDIPGYKGSEIPDVSGGTDMNIDIHLEIN